MNSLASLGLNDHFTDLLKVQDISRDEIGRVLRQDKTQYIVKTNNREATADLTGNFLHSDLQLPVVGDWVRVIDFDDTYIITEPIPRYSQLTRRAVRYSGKEQLIAANIDQAFIVQSVDHDFNLNRLERYIAIAYDGNIEPIVVTNKTDLISEQQLETLVSTLKNRINREISIIAISAQDDTVLSQIQVRLKPGTTSCFLGSSGVGKSTIVNSLIGSNTQSTSHISQTTGKGTHTTTSRQMFVSKPGGLIIDTPGMREIGMAVSKQGLDTSFSTISELATQCKFSDCKHQGEPGCAIQAAIASEALDIQQLDNYQKLKSESARFQRTKAEQNREGKKLGKVIKEAKAFRSQRKP